MINTFIPTANVNRCTEICTELADPQSLIGPSLAMISGRAGRGKTEFAKYFAVNSTAVYVAPMNVRSPAMLLREISYELCELRPYTLAKCLEVIADEMKKDRRLIFIDEADLLPISLLEMLRNVNERYACPIVMIGEEGLKIKIASRRRLASRIRASVEVGPVQAADTALFYRKSLGQEIPPAITRLIHKDSNGDWRPLLMTAIAIEQALKASGLDDISEDLVKAVVGNGRK